MTTLRAELLCPVFVLAGWTFVVLLMIPIARVRAGRRGQVRIDDFRYGESPSVPGPVSLPNRNLMNLLELPVLFYVACLLLVVTGGTSATAVGLAWAYVALRIAHSAIHLTINRVPYRLATFALSNGVLLVLWVVAGLHVAALRAD